VTVNGEPRTVADGTSVQMLLEQLKLSPRNVAVEINRDLAPRAGHAGRILQEGDRLEIVTLVGGG